MPTAPSIRVARCRPFGIGPTVPVITEVLCDPGGLSGRKRYPQDAPCLGHDRPTFRRPLIRRCGKRRRRTGRLRTGDGKGRCAMRSPGLQGRAAVRSRTLMTRLPNWFEAKQNNALANFFSRTSTSDWRRCGYVAGDGILRSGISRRLVTVDFRSQRRLKMGHFQRNTHAFSSDGMTKYLPGRAPAA